MYTQEMYIKAGIFTKVKIVNDIRANCLRLRVLFNIKEENAGFLMVKIHVVLTGNQDKVVEVVKAVEKYF